MNDVIKPKIYPEIWPEFSKGKDLPPICYLCGESLVEGYTEDHLPPKGLFPKKDKSLLLVVFACNRCHPKKHISMNDEYFRNCIEVWVGKDKMHPEVVSRRKRAWKRRPLQGIDMLVNEEPIFVESDSGIFQPRYLIKMKSRRINSVIERMGKGFHFSRYKKRVPSIANVYFNESSVDSEKRDGMLYPVAPGFVLIPKRLTVRHWSFSGGILNESNWIFKFYEGPEFFVKFEWLT